MNVHTKLVRLCGLGGGLVASLAYLQNEKPDSMAQFYRLRVCAKERVNDLHQGLGTKWDSNWDRRDPSSMVKPLKEGATDDEKAAREAKLIENKPKASRILVLVRHGQYNLEGTQDSERYLTDLGRKQAEVTGKRLVDLYSHFLQKTDENGNLKTSNIKLTKSTMARATETANIILKQMPVEIENTTCDLIREGAPCVPEPPLESWLPAPSDFFQEGARIEAGFRRHFHRADPAQEETSVDILVCHGNVIRYCVCRALQLDPQAWLRMAVHNGSITVLVIKPSGRVSLLELGGAGHFESNMLTFN